VSPTGVTKRSVQRSWGAGTPRAYGFAARHITEALVAVGSGATSKPDAREEAEKARAARPQR
jgi:hypothetical protein